MISIETVATSVSLKKIGKSLDVDVTKLPQGSLTHIFDYGLRQILNDAMASAKTEAEGEAAAKKRLDNLLSGTLRASPVREGNPVRARAFDLAFAAVQAAPGFQAWLAKASLKKSDKDAIKVAREKATEAINVEGNKFMAQAALDVEAAKGLDIEIEL